MRHICPIPVCEYCLSVETTKIRWPITSMAVWHDAGIKYDSLERYS